jgi:MFS family permease
LSNSFGGLIAAGLVSGLEGKGGLEGWRWLFIVEGAITVFVGIAVYFILPSYPSKTKFFSEEQRRLAVWRTTQDANGEPDEGGETSLVKGAKLVIKDWKVSLDHRRRYATTVIDHSCLRF